MLEDTKIRTIEQNKKMWDMLRDVSEQVPWQVDGKIEKLTPDEWKDMFTAALKKHQRVAAGIDGGFVILGLHTSRMLKSEMSELITLMEAFGVEHNVQWGEDETKI